MSRATLYASSDLTALRAEPAQTSRARPLSAGKAGVEHDRLKPGQAVDVLRG